MADNATDFRSLRDTHAAWLALEGVADRTIQRRLGHASGDTTDRHIKAAESFDVDAIGRPFPPLAHWPGRWPNFEPIPKGFKRLSVARVGFEPTTFGL